MRMMKSCCWSHQVLRSQGTSTICKPSTLRGQCFGMRRGMQDSWCCCVFSAWACLGWAEVCRISDVAFTASAVFGISRRMQDAWCCGVFCLQPDGMTVCLSCQVCDCTFDVVLLRDMIQLCDWIYHKTNSFCIIWFNCVIECIVLRIVFTWYDLIMWLNHIK